LNRRGTLYIILTTLTILAIVAIEYNKPKEINWFPSYTKHHKIPFGTLVFHDQLKRIFKESGIVNVERPPYEYLTRNPESKGTYLFINDGLAFGEAELDKLLDWTSKGNTLFVAASSRFEQELLDTLSLDQSGISTFNNFNNDYVMLLKHPQLRSDSVYVYDRANYFNQFSKIDTLKSKVIGTIRNPKDEDSIKDKEYINIIKQPFGEGEIILSTFPQAFTNYFILNNPNNHYTASLTSYLDPTKPIYYDSHHKSGKTIFTSPLTVMLNTKELKWSYYIMLLGVLVYIIFEGKRKQRAIPIVTPLRNQTIEFTRTISNMYYEKGKHKDIAYHIIQHFLDYIRTNLHLNTSSVDDEFLKNLSARSNNTIEDTQVLFNTIERINKKTTLSNIELEKLNSLIEKFKSNNTWKTKT